MTEMSEDIKRIIAYKKARLEHLEQSWIAYTKNMECGELKEFKQSCVDDEIIIEALKKQIPTKPIISTHKAINGNTKEESTYHITHCPYCWEDKQLGYFESVVDKGVKYCRRCGQALDWSDKK